MKILIAGGNGFIGSNFVKVLSKLPQYNIESIKRSDCDLTLPSSLRDVVLAKKPDVLIHAGVSISDSNNNLNMYYALENISNLVSKVIIFGSGAEYGHQRYIPLMSEDYFDPLQSPRNNDPYHTSKFTISRLHSQSLANNIYNLRLFGVYGVNEDYTRRLITNNILNFIMTGQMAYNRDIAFDYLYVDDLIQAVEHFLTIEKPMHNTYNICSGKADKFSYILSELIQALGGTEKSIICNDPSPSDYEYSGSSKRFEDEFSFKIHKTPYKQSALFLKKWLNSCATK